MSLHDLFDLPANDEKPVEEDVKENLPELFDIVNSIFHKRNFILNEQTNKAYVKFMINKALSMGKDTIYYANEMNSFPGISNNLHHDFLNGVIRQVKRRNPWCKGVKQEDVDVIKFFMKKSSNEAKQLLPLLTKEQREELRTKMNQIMGKPL